MNRPCLHPRIFDASRQSPPTGSKALPWNPLNCRLRLQFYKVLALRSQCKARQSLGSSAFPGRARERELSRELTTDAMSERARIFRCFQSISWLVVASLLVCSVGCEDANSKQLQRLQAEQASGKERRDSLREAFRYLPQLVRMDRSVALREIQSELNTWSKNVVEPTDWKSANSLESVSASLRTIDFSNRIAKLEFGEPECEFLLQSQMMRDVGKWVLERPYHDNLFKGWLEKQKSVLPADDWRQLETTLKLFDWTICNVAIDGQAKDVERLVTNSDMPLSDQAPVYRQLPWQTLMFARGDTWQRARVFTQLAFAHGIDAVVLALPSASGATENASLRLWCIAVPIAGKFFLFEPQWGLPIPSQVDDGIATLKEAKENPAVLQRAKLFGFFEYPVEPKDLSGLIALIDVEPFALGRTMHTLERTLTGENRLRVSIDADAFEKRINSIDEKLPVRLWNVPWLAQVYNQSSRERMNDKSPFSMNYMGTYGAFITDTPISRARGLHLNGKFDSSIEAAGALRSYMDVRVDEQTLKDLEVDRETQAKIGIVRKPNETLENFQFQIQQAQVFLRRSKFDVAAFLAMLNLDMDKPDTTIDWLTKRLIALPGTEIWRPHAHYLLGRAHEQQSNTAAAIEEYKFENSPQAAGNRMRIRKLNASTGKTSQ